MSLTKIAGSGSVSLRYGSPDPYQNVTDPQHPLKFDIIFIIILKPEPGTRHRFCLKLAQDELNGFRYSWVPCSPRLVVCGSTRTGQQDRSVNICLLCLIEKTNGNE